MNRKGSIKKILLVLLLFLTAGVLMSYPFIANLVFEHRTDSIVKTVEESSIKADHTKVNEIIKKAKEYNKSISDGCIQLQDPFIEEIQMEKAERYSSVLNLNGNEVMGIIEIPCIEVKLPIYHGTSGDVLEKGIGHLQGTSLPVGGKSTHSVLTGHTGLSNAKLFTDLTEVKKDDVFFLNVVGEKLAYKVDKIKVVLPTELSDLYVVNNKDYCTLVTCTPYGVNTHRLLVRGTRVEYEKIIENPDVLKSNLTESNWMREYQQALKISVGIFCISIGCIFYKRKNRRTIKNEYKNKS